MQTMNSDFGVFVVCRDVDQLIPRLPFAISFISSHSVLVASLLVKRLLLGM